MKNNNFNSARIKKICETKGKITFGSGRSKENNGWLIIGGQKIVRITVPKGRKSIPRGTYSNMARQLKLSVEDFDRFLECPMSSEEFLSNFGKQPE